MFDKLRYYRFVIRWMWENRTWKNTRQKWKAMDKAWIEHVANRAEAMYLSKG